MTVSNYIIEPTRSLVRVVMLDSNTPAEIVDLCERILRDPAYRPGFGFLVDRRGLAKPPRADTIRALAAFAREYAPQLGPCRMAIVTTSATAQWWPWRTGATLLAHYARITLELFDEYQAAEDWVAPAPLG